MHRCAVHLWWTVLLAGAFPASSEILVQGRVTDPGGRPPEDVRVVLEPIADRYRRALDRLAGTRPSEPASSATPDADGRFELTAPEPGLWRVVIEAPGRRSVSYRLRPLVQSILLPPHELEPAVDVEVRVVDPEGRPRRAAVASYDQDPGRGWVRRYQLVHTGEDGIARLVRGASEKVAFEVLALEPDAGLVPLQAQDVAVGSSGRLRLELEAGAPATIRLTDTAGEGVEGVLAFRGSGLLPLGCSDATGRLRLAFREGDPSLWFLAADGSSGAWKLDLAPEDIVDEDAHGGDDTVLALHPPRTLRGRVVDAKSGEPIERALVLPSTHRFATTLQSGEFTIDVPALEASQQLRIRAVAPGYGQSRERHPLAHGWPRDLRILLPRAGRVAGVVVDAAGDPVSGALVYAVPATYADVTATRPFALHSGSWRTRSGEDGRFVLHTLAPEAGHEIVCEKAGFAPARRKMDGLDPASPPQLRIVLEAGITARGAVVDAAGVPVADARVVLRRAPLSGDPILGGRRRLRSDERSRQPAATDADGRFAIPDLAPGRYDLDARAEGFAPAAVPGIEIEPGVAEVDLGTLELTLGATISGRIVDVDGRGVARARIGLARTGGGSPYQEIAAGDDGDFTVGSLAPGAPFTLTVSRDGYTPETVMAVAEPGSEPLEIVLEPAVRIAGRVLDSERRGLEGVEITAMPMRPNQLHAFGGRPPTTHTGADGRFVLESVPVGLVSLSAEKEGFQPHHLPNFDVGSAGVTEDVEIVLRPGVVLNGTVTGPDGDPVAKAVVLLERIEHDHTSSQSKMSDAAGRYQFTGLAPGRYSLAAGLAPGRFSVAARLTPELRNSARTVEIEAGVHTVDLVVEPGFEISGWVRDAAGEPIVGAGLILVPHTEMEAGFSPMFHYRFSGQAFARSAAGGSFVIEDVPPGRYVVVADKEGYATARTPEAVEVDAADVAGIVLEMGRGVTLRGRVVGLELEELAVLSIRLVTEYGESVIGQVDYEGRYTVLNLTPGAWHLQASAEGRQLSERLEIEHGTSEIVRDLEFPSGYTLSGSVTFSTPEALEQPLSGAYVSLRPMGDFVSSRSTTTDSLGRFRFRELPPGRYTVSVHGDGLYLNDELDFAGDQELRLEVTTAWVRGFVHDAATGLPLEGVSLGLETLPEDGPGRRLSVAGGAVSDAAGRFHLRRVPEGMWRLWARKEGFGPAEATLDLRSGAPLEGLALEMTSTLGVTLGVVLETGEAPPYVRAAVFDRAGRRILTELLKPSPEGRARLTTVPAGSWVLALWNQDALAPDVPFTAPGDVGQIVLRRSGALHLVVEELLAAAPETGASASVELRSPDGRPYHPPMRGLSRERPHRWPMGGGEATIPRLLPGLWSWTVIHEDGRTWSGQADVVAGETVEVRAP